MTCSFRAGVVDGAYQQRVSCAGGYRPELATGRAQAPKRERAYTSSRRQSLHLEHARGLEKECDVAGPFDVVLMDLALPRLLHALLQVVLSFLHSFAPCHPRASSPPLQLRVTQILSCQTLPCAPVAWALAGPILSHSPVQAVMLAHDGALLITARFGRAVVPGSSILRYGRMHLYQA